MRIIAGSLKGRQLNTPTGIGLRPTSAKLRETLFNVIGPKISGANVIDAFAGTGAVGIEALSRGAAHVTFIEYDNRTIRLTTENIRRCGIKVGYEIIFGSFKETMKKNFSVEEFDLIFLDPPYDEDGLKEIIKSAEPKLAVDGLLVIEHSKRRRAPGVAGRMRRMRTLLSGDSSLDFYQLFLDIDG